MNRNNIQAIIKIMEFTLTGTSESTLLWRLRFTASQCRVAMRLNVLSCNTRSKRLPNPTDYAPHQKSDSCNLKRSYPCFLIAPIKCPA